MDIQQLKVKLQGLLNDLDTLYIEDRRKNGHTPTNSLYPTTHIVKNFKKLEPRQEKLLKRVSEEKAGMTPDSIKKLTLRLGYKRPHSYGGYLKGRRASLVKTYLPSGEARIFLSKTGMQLLGANTTGANH